MKTQAGNVDEKQAEEETDAKQINEELSLVCYNFYIQFYLLTCIFR